MSHTPETSTITDNVNKVVRTPSYRTNGTTLNGYNTTTISSSDGTFRMTTSSSVSAPADSAAGLPELVEVCDDMIDHWNAVKTAIASVAPSEESSSSSSQG